MCASTEADHLIQQSPDVPCSMSHMRLRTPSLAKDLASLPLPERTSNMNLPRRGRGRLLPAEEQAATRLKNEGEAGLCLLAPRLASRVRAMWSFCTLPAFM